MTTTTTKKKPSIKEAEKFFRYAANKLVGLAQMRELTSWAAAEAWLVENCPFDLQVSWLTNTANFSPATLKEELYTLQCNTVKSLANEQYANKIIQQVSKPTHAKGEVESGKVEKTTTGEESGNNICETVSGDVSISSDSQASNSMPPAPSLPLAAQVLTRKEQRKAHRRYEGWYSRIPTELLAENGGTIPPLDKTKQSAELLYYQVDAAVPLFNNFVIKSQRAQLLRAGVGVGKTYIFGQLLRWLFDIEFHKGPVFSLFPYMVVTKAPIVTQTERVLRDKFGLPIGNFSGGVMVTNYDQLRASLGNIMIDWHEQVVNGEVDIFPVWKDNIHPCVVIWDECQSLKNEGSTQTKIARAYSRIADKTVTEDELVKHPAWTYDNIIELPEAKYKVPNTWQLFSSATPFTTVAEAKTFALATRARVSSENMIGYKGD